MSTSILIWKSLGKLIDELNPKIVSDTTKGKVPKIVEDKIKSYTNRMDPPLWTNADYDLVVLIALSIIMWENKIRFYSISKEPEIQFKLGVHALSKIDTEAALAKMRQEKLILENMSTQCSAMIPLGIAIVGKSALLGPANASQVLLNEIASNKLSKKCHENMNAIPGILRKFERIRKINEDILRTHRKH